MLTPDNYVEQVLPVIESAKTRVYMQLQYIHADKNSPTRFLSLVRAVQQKIAKGLDVRIIVHEREAQADWIEKMRTDLQFETSVIRIQPGIHNKGTVVDSSIAIVGSHNWSGDGTTRNRDASLIFYNATVAKYFEQIFLHDWTTLARTYSYHPPQVRIAKPGEPTPPGFDRMTLSELIANVS